MKKLFTSLLLLAAGTVHAVFTSTGTQTPWGLYAGAGTGSAISKHATFDDCVKAAAAIATKAMKMTCKPPASNVTVTVATAPPPVQTWTRIAVEGATFTVGTSQTVRYGANGAYVTKTLSGAGECSNTFFGSDPLSGIVKACDVLDGSGTPPAPPTTGTATLSWTAPTTSLDGTPLTDLAGYRVQWGQASGAYTQSVPVDASSTSLVIPNLGPGAWFFIVKAVDTSGNESPPSTEASKVVP